MYPWTVDKQQGGLPTEETRKYGRHVMEAESMQIMKQMYGTT